MITTILLIIMKSMRESRSRKLIDGRRNAGFSNFRLPTANFKLIIISLLLIVVVSCKKTTNQQIDPESGIDCAEAEYLFANIYQVVTDVVQYDTLSKKAVYNSELIDSKKTKRAESY